VVGSLLVFFFLFRLLGWSYEEFHCTNDFNRVIVIKRKDSYEGLMLEG